MAGQVLLLVLSGPHVYYWIDFTYELNNIGLNTHQKMIQFSYINWQLIGFTSNKVQK